MVLFKCRCSSIGRMMANSRSNPGLTEKQKEYLDQLESKDKLTEKQSADLAELLVRKENSKKLVLSDGCIEMLMEEYAWQTEKMIPIDKELTFIPSLERGKESEEDSITLLTRLDKVLYRKNTERIYNDYLTGEPDIFEGENIYAAEKITDIKSKWDYPTFLKCIHQPLENSYTDQLQGYCDISGAGKAEVVKCLVSMPEMQVLDSKRRLLFKMGCATDESPDFLRVWNLLERSMKFDHIPIHKRVYRLPVEPFTEVRRQQVYDRVKQCREWLRQFAEMYETLNK